MSVSRRGHRAPGFTRSYRRTRRTVQIEGWFPPLAREQDCFDVIKDANHENRRIVQQPSSKAASGSDACRGREATREADRTPSNGHLNPSQPPRTPQPPRRTCRLGADAYVARIEDRRRRGEICLDNSFHRSVWATYARQSKDQVGLEYLLPRPARRLQADARASVFPERARPARARLGDSGLQRGRERGPFSR